MFRIAISNLACPSGVSPVGVTTPHGGRRACLSAGIHYALLVLTACGGGDKETCEVQPRKLNEAVYASGETMPEKYYFLGTNTADHIMKIGVSEGDTVEAGRLLAVLGSPEEDRQAALLAQQLSLAREAAGEQSEVLDELRERIQLAAKQLQQDSLDAARYRELADEKAVPETEAENARLAWEGSRTEYLTLQRQYNSRRNELKQSALQAEEQLVRLEESRSGKTLISPMSGKIYEIYHKEATLVNPGDPVILVGSFDEFMLELLVDERDISKIKRGQKVYFQTESHGEQQFEARISKIVPVLQKQNRSFSVEATITSPGNFFPQASVEANIVIREDAKALVIPADYLLEGDSVWLQKREEAGKVKVVPGTLSGNWVEIKEGLKAGDIVRQP